MPDPYTTQIRAAAASLLAGVSGITSIVQGVPYREASDSANLPQIAIHWGPIASELDGGKDRRHRKTGTLILSLSGKTTITADDINQSLNAPAATTEAALDQYFEDIEAALDASPTLGLSFVQRSNISAAAREIDARGEALLFNLTLQLSITWTYQPA